MSEWPVIPSNAAVRSAAEKAMLPLGFQRNGKDAFVASITKDLLAIVSFIGGNGGQSLHISVVSVPANKLALDVWRSLKREWSFGRQELYPGVPLQRTWFRGSHVLDEETWTRQRHWIFFELKAPHAPKPVTLEAFGADMAKIGERLMRDTSTLEAALANPRFHTSPNWELEPTVYALLGDRAGFDISVQGVFDRFEQRRKEAENAPPPKPGEIRMQLGGPTLNFEGYFEEVRRRCF
jgi:hypothetical protein